MDTDVDTHIKIIRDGFFTKIWNEKNFAIADEIFANDFITESIGLDPSNWKSTHGTGPESMTHHIKWWLEIIPDAKMEVIDIAATGNTVIANWELRGTMRGDVFGVSPTNQVVQIFGCTVSYFQDGRINLNKTLFDRLGFFQQLNILPSTVTILKRK